MGGLGTYVRTHLPKNLDSELSKHMTPNYVGGGTSIRTTTPSSKWHRDNVADRRTTLKRLSYCLKWCQNCAFWMAPERRFQWCLKDAANGISKSASNGVANGASNMPENGASKGTSNGAWTASEWWLRRTLNGAWTTPRSPKTIENLFICVLKGIFGEDGTEFDTNCYISLISIITKTYVGYIYQFI